MSAISERMTLQVIVETTRTLKDSCSPDIDQERITLLEQSLGAEIKTVKKKLEDFEMLKVLGKGTFGKVRLKPRRDCLFYRRKVVITVNI